MASKGNALPLQTYQGLAIPQKREFQRKYLGRDKRFDFLTATEHHESKESAKYSLEEGWLSRYQISEREKLPIDSELLQDRLPELPCREHESAAYRSRNEKQYYYTSGVRLDRTMESSRSLDLASSSKVGSKEAAQLLEGVDDAIQQTTPVRLSLEDQPQQVKLEPEVLESQRNEAQFKDQSAKIKKLAKSMSDCTLEALSVKACLEEIVAKDKPYLREMLDHFIKQYQLFQNGREQVTEVQATTPSEFNKDFLHTLTKALTAGQAHYEAFRTGTLKDAAALVK
jgi:hypothetical protein